MRGYLQRLASAVRQPAGSIRPIVGSVFAPPPSYMRDSPIAAESVVERKASPGRAGNRETVTAPGAQTVHPQLPAYTPLLGYSAAPLATTQPRTPMEDGSLDRERRESPQLVNEKVGEPRERDVYAQPVPQEVVVQQIYAPLLNESARPFDQQIVVHAEKFGVPGRAQPNSPRVAASPRHEPDEIQIHIGRIEVTAVQPTPAAPAAKPARRGLNLEEYLKRSDGRV